MNIGETDLNVIKSPKTGQPIIPGSTIKGKLRSLLAKLEGSKVDKKDSGLIKTIFGYSKTKKEDGSEENKEYVTRLIVRDAWLANAEELESWEMENPYTENKWENTIIRSKGSAEHPRQLERVPQGAEFQYEMILDVYDEDEGKGYLEAIKKAMRLLEDDYLGGSGTRGYGKIKFIENSEDSKPIDKYANH